MLKIEINDKYRVQSDGYQFLLIQKSIVTKEGAKTLGEESTKTIGYFHTIPQVFKALVDQEILQSNSTDFKHLVEEIKQLKADLTGILNKLLAIL